MKGLFTRSVIKPARAEVSVRAGFGVKNSIG